MEKLLEQFKCAWNETILLCSLDTVHYDLEAEILRLGNDAIFKAAIFPSHYEFEDSRTNTFSFSHSMSYDEALPFLRFVRDDFIETHEIRMPGIDEKHGIHCIENDTFTLKIKINSDIEQQLAEQAQEEAIKKFGDSQRRFSKRFNEKLIK